jgi:hypothetical protein
VPESARPRPAFDNQEVTQSPLATTLQRAESAHISARLLAKNLQTAPVAESPLPREGRSRGACA